MRACRHHPISLLARAGLSDRSSRFLGSGKSGGLHWGTTRPPFLRWLWTLVVVTQSGKFLERANGKGEKGRRMKMREKTRRCIWQGKKASRKETFVFFSFWTNPIASHQTQELDLTPFFFPSPFLFLKKMQIYPPTQLSFNRKFVNPIIYLKILFVK